MGKIINEIGNTYGYLTVIDRASNKDGRAMWKCKCKCGKETIVSGKALRSGATRSCGCLKKELLVKRNLELGGDLTGFRFGKLTVLGFHDWKIKANGKRTRIWKCQCDCGNICYIQHQYLTFGDTSSCGCAHSKGNATITRLLNSKNIYYISEYHDSRFKSSDNGNFYFDFAITDKDRKVKFFIEYQGSIHFYAEGNGWNTKENLEKRQKLDKEKKQLCENFNIPLYYITYLDDIKARLEEILRQNEYESFISN